MVSPSAAGVTVAYCASASMSALQRSLTFSTGPSGVLIDGTERAVLLLGVPAGLADALLEGAAVGWVPTDLPEEGPAGAAFADAVAEEELAALPRGMSAMTAKMKMQHQSETRAQSTRHCCNKLGPENERISKPAPTMQCMLEQHRSARAGTYAIALRRRPHSAWAPRRTCTPVTTSGCGAFT